MPRFAYVGPIDGLDIPLLRLSDVRRGDEFDCTDEQAALLGAQPDNYQPVDAAAEQIAATAIAEAEQAFAAAVPQPAADEEPTADQPHLDAITDAAPADDPAQEG